MGGMMTAEKATDWSRWSIPPDEGYTVDDLLTLDLPPHTELIDGSFVFMAPQRSFHSLMIDHLVQSLRAACPDRLRVRREMVVKLSDQTALEPDVLVVKADRAGDHDLVIYGSDDVVLAVETMSPSSRERDRDTKPHKYAGVGVPYFWRIEQDGDQRYVGYTYELDRQDGRDRPTGTHVNRLTIDRPFPVDIDLTEVDRL
ncbi:MAG: Uma2 family endonuclease [Microlunatus sp.]|nr:Uma2 family endonuclease [Microlunatus sp.]